MSEVGIPVLTEHKKVSIQLVSPASGEAKTSEVELAGVALRFPFNQFPQRVGRETDFVEIDVDIYKLVSIQLVSPASGERMTYDLDPLFALSGAGFHSISFPSEWGVGSSKGELV